MSAVVFDGLIMNLSAPRPAYENECHPLYVFV